LIGQGDEPGGGGYPSDQKGAGKKKDENKEISPHPWRRSEECYEKRGNGKEERGREEMAG
jgi:hypothetical protein